MLTATLFKSMMELIMTNVRSSNILGNNINIQSLHHDVQFLVLKENLIVLVLVNFKFWKERLVPVFVNLVILMELLVFSEVDSSNYATFGFLYSQKTFLKTWIVMV
jgi:hypothetical protein